MLIPIRVCVRPETFELLKEAADRSGYDFYDFVSDLLVGAADQEYAQQQTDTARTEGNA